jgi:phage terminase small subunit
MNEQIEKRISALEDRVSKLEQKNSSVVTDNPIMDSKKKVSIKEFLMGKKVDDDVKRTLVIAYFLEHVEKHESVNTDDLKKAFSLAKSPLPSNINDKVNMNIKNAHMMEASEKKDNKKAWVLTATGEQFVEIELNK